MNDIKIFESAQGEIQVNLEQELEEEVTTKDFLVVQKEGNRQVKRNIKHYNLDAISLNDRAIESTL